MPFLFLLFIGVPIAEIVVFIQVNSLIGLWPTLGGIVLTAAIGAGLVRRQGLSALSRAQNQLQQNKLPVDEVFTGACLLIAGAMLLTPGFLTDTIGFLLLVPPLRRWMGRGVIGAIGRHGRFTAHPGAGPARRGSGGNVIDGEYEIVAPANSNDDTDTVVPLPGRDRPPS